MGSSWIGGSWRPPYLVFRGRRRKKKASPPVVYIEAQRRRADGRIERARLPLSAFDSMPNRVHGALYQPSAFVRSDGTRGYRFPLEGMYWPRWSDFDPVILARTFHDALHKAFGDDTLAWDELSDALRSPMIEAAKETMETLYPFTYPEFEVFWEVRAQ